MILLDQLAVTTHSIGISASRPPLTEEFHGIAWERLLTRLRHTLTALRTLPTGERLPDCTGHLRPLDRQMLSRRVGMGAAANAVIEAAGADSVNLVLAPNRPEDELSEILNVIAPTRSILHQSSLGPGASAGRGRS